MWSRREAGYGDDYYTDPYARGDTEARGKGSRVDAERRTLESFNDRQERDPTGYRSLDSGDNVDHDWDRKTRDRNDRAMYDSRAQLSARDDYADEDEDIAEDRDYDDEQGEPAMRASRNKDVNWRTDIKYTRPRHRDSLAEVEGESDTTFTDMSWRDEERALGPRHNDRDWRNYVRNDRTDELYDKQKGTGKDKLRQPKADNELQKDEAERDWKKGNKSDVFHVVCVDESADADRAFRFATRNLPREHRLVLAHGLYEGLLGHNRSDEDRLRRVGNKYLQACSEMGRECTFRHFHYTSSGNFGEEVCDLAARAHAKSVLVGKRSQISDMRRTLAGSTSRSVLEACRVPVTIVAKGEKGLANSASW